MLILVDSALQKILNDTLAVVGTPNAGLFSAIKVALFTDANPITTASVLADKTEATYTGYARSGNVVWGAPYRGPEGKWRIAGAGILFISSDGVTPNLIYAAGLVTGSGGGTVLQAGDLFATPRNLDRAGEGFLYTPVVELPPGPWGGGLLID